MYLISQRIINLNELQVYNFPHSQLTQKMWHLITRFKAKSMQMEEISIKDST